MASINLNNLPFKELTWTDPCPVGKEWKGVPLEDTSANFLLWCFQQEWCKTKYPALWHFINKRWRTLEEFADEERAKDNFKKDSAMEFWREDYF